MTTKDKHAGDCTIYASLSNGSPTDGICTCGYGFGKGFAEASNCFSMEKLATLKEVPTVHSETKTPLSFKEYWDKQEPIPKWTVEMYARAAWESRGSEIAELIAMNMQMREELAQEKEDHNLLKRNEQISLDNWRGLRKELVQMREELIEAKDANEALGNNLYINSEIHEKELNNLGSEIAQMREEYLNVSTALNRKQIDCKTLSSELAQERAARKDIEWALRKLVNTCCGCEINKTIQFREAVSALASLNNKEAV